MESLESLTNRGLRAYELGRLRMAARVAVVLVPVMYFCLLEPVGREACACCGALLLVAAIWFRFRNRAGVDGVTTGLFAGGIPLTAALALTKLDPGCATAGTLSFCSAFSVLVGGAAGAVVALRETTQGDGARHWPLAATIAALAAGLGCARLGVAGIAGVAAGIAVGRAATALARRSV